MTMPTSFSTLHIGTSEIRCASVDGRRWFAVADVCKALGIINKRRGYTRYVRAIDERNKQMVVFPQPERGRPSLVTVSEAGLDRLLHLRAGALADHLRQTLLSESDNQERAYMQP